MLILERFEGDTALIEDDDRRFDVARTALPPTAKEGDVLVLHGAQYLVDEAATVKRRARIRALYRKVKQP